VLLHGGEEKKLTGLGDGFQTKGNWKKPVAKEC